MRLKNVVYQLFVSLSLGSALPALWQGAVANAADTGTWINWASGAFASTAVIVAYLCSLVVWALAVSEVHYEGWRVVLESSYLIGLCFPFALTIYKAGMGVKDVFFQALVHLSLLAFLDLPVGATVLASLVLGPLYLYLYTDAMHEAGMGPSSWTGLVMRQVGCAVAWSGGVGTMHALMLDEFGVAAKVSSGAATNGGPRGAVDLVLAKLEHGLVRLKCSLSPQDRTLLLACLMLAAPASCFVQCIRPFFDKHGATPPGPFQLYISFLCMYLLGTLEVEHLRAGLLRKLRASQELLHDLLPVHVVRTLLEAQGIGRSRPISRSTSQHDNLAATAATAAAAAGPSSKEQSFSAAVGQGPNGESGGPATGMAHACGCEQAAQGAVATSELPGKRGAGCSREGGLEEGEAAAPPGAYRLHATAVRQRRPPVASSNGSGCAGYGLAMEDSARGPPLDTLLHAGLNNNTHVSRTSSETAASDLTMVGANAELLTLFSNIGPLPAPGGAAAAAAAVGSGSMNMQSTLNAGAANAHGMVSLLQQTSGGNSAGFLMGAFHADQALPSADLLHTIYSEGTRESSGTSCVLQPLGAGQHELQQAGSEAAITHPLPGGAGDDSLNTQIAVSWLQHAGDDAALPAADEVLPGATEVQEELGEEGRGLTTAQHSGSSTSSTMQRALSLGQQLATRLSQDLMPGIVASGAAGARALWATSSRVTGLLRGGSMRVPRDLSLASGGENQGGRDPDHVRRHSTDASTSGTHGLQVPTAHGIRAAVAARRSFTLRTSTDSRSLHTASTSPAATTPRAHKPLHTVLNGSHGGPAAVSPTHSSGGSLLGSGMQWLSSALFDTAASAPGRLRGLSASSLRISAWGSAEVAGVVEGDEEGIGKGAGGDGGQWARGGAEGRISGPAAQVAVGAQSVFSAATSEQGGNAHLGGIRHLSLAEWHDGITIVFTDVVGFTTIAQQIHPQLVMGMLNKLYTRFDNLCLKSGNSVYKVETIGDSYMLATGLLASDPHHALTALQFAFAMRREAAKVRVPNPDGTGPQEYVKIRIGMHSGRAMSGIVGMIRRRYCLFGDTVNTASRMESSGAPMAVHLSDDTYRLLLAAGAPAQGVTFSCRGRLLVKGKGEMTTWWAHEAGEVAARPLQPATAAATTAATAAVATSAGSEPEGAVGEGCHAAASPCAADRAGPAGAADCAPGHPVAKASTHKPQTHKVEVEAGVAPCDSAM